MTRSLMVALLAVAILALTGCPSPGGGGGGGGLPDGKLVKDLTKTVVVEAADKPITVDGKLNEAAWKNAAAMDGFVAGKDKPAPQASRVLVSYDKDNLYLAVVNNEPNTDKLVTKVKEKGGNVWEDDSIEVYVDPKNAKAGRSGEHIGFFVNAANVTYTRQHGGDKAFDFTSKTSTIAGKAWVAELAIPWKSLGVTPKPGHKFGLMVARNRLAGEAKQQGSYLVFCSDEAKDTSVYPTLELR